MKIVLICSSKLISSLNLTYHSSTPDESCQFICGLRERRFRLACRDNNSPMRAWVHTDSKKARIGFLFVTRGRRCGKRLRVSGDDSSGGKPAVPAGELREAGVAKTEPEHCAGAGIDKFRFAETPKKDCDNKAVHSTASSRWVSRSAKAAFFAASSHAPIAMARPTAPSCSSMSNQALCAWGTPHCR